MQNSSYNPIINDSELKVTDAARGKMYELIQNTDESIKGIRVYVSGGGCGGMSYGMTYADSESEYDRVLEAENFNLYADVVALTIPRWCRN